MEPKARMTDWPSVRPVVLHVYENEVPEIGRDARSTTDVDYFAWLLLAGEVTVEDHGSQLTGRVGDWVIAHPGPRYQRFTNDARILSIRFQAHWPDGYPLFDEGLSTVIPTQEAPELELQARALLRMAAPLLPNDPFAIRETPLTLCEYLAFQATGLTFLFHLFGELAARGISPTRLGQTDERLLSVVRRLDQWPLDLALDLKHIVKSSGLTPKHLSRLFSAEFGISPVHYFAQRRRSHAQQLLAHTGVPIKVIAIDLGFPSVADFSSWFKRAHGCPPSVYRQRAATAPLP